MITRDLQGRFIKGDKFWLGKNRSEETNQKISDSLKGHIPWNKGLNKENDNRVFIGAEKEKRQICRECKYCHKKYFVIKARTASNFCSWDCKTLWQKENYLKGNKSPFWKGGYENKKILNMKRRALKFLAIGGHTLLEWENLKIKFNYTCLSCGRKEPEIKLTEDHIVPLTKNGSNNIDNIQPLCKSCNSIKRDKTIDYRGVLICQI